MSIQWFPGHMNVAYKKAAEMMKKVDLIIEVLDARLPQASCNPIIEQLRLYYQRSCLKILNKSDLADSTITRIWITFLNKQKNVNATILNSKNYQDIKKIPKLALKLVPHRGSALKPLRIMIMGIPNVGKSTIINALLKKYIAAVGNEPAITKRQQCIYLNKNMILIDTPGILSQKILDQSDGMLLAANHAISKNAFIVEEVAVFLADKLLRYYPQLLTARYGFKTIGMDGVNVIENIANIRNFFLQKDTINFKKAADTFLQDYRSGILGCISLEIPRSC